MDLKAENMRVVFYIHDITTLLLMYFVHPFLVSTFFHCRYHSTQLYHSTQVGFLAPGHFTLLRSWEITQCLLWSWEAAAFIHWQAVAYTVRLPTDWHCQPFSLLLLASIVTFWRFSPNHTGFSAHLNLFWHCFAGCHWFKYARFSVVWVMIIVLFLWPISHWQCLHITFLIGSTLLDPQPRRYNYPSPVTRIKNVGSYIRICIC